MYKGKVGSQNKVLRGETDINPGDTFYVEGDSTGRFMALRYTPLPNGSKEPAYKNFAVLHVGQVAKCVQAAETNTVIPWVK
ncbi:MAG: hypothetical protein M0R48_10980 [Candidatus Omnitrophica bacterium]|nr:hypothetical protein [Candidatus Omnitrophota bacterium]